MSQRFESPNGSPSSRVPGVLAAASPWMVALFLWFLCSPSPATGAVIHVPGDQSTIQHGIAAAVAGDTVLVAAGTYFEHNLEVRSGICLRSETGLPECVTIDAGQLGRVLHCSLVSTSTRIEGFTLTGGSMTNDYGGGIYCINSAPTISRCVLTGNYASAGGSGIYCAQSDPVLRECRIVDNLRSVDGGGLYCSNSSPTVTSCLFASNSALFWGGAVFCSNSSPRLTNCTLVGNAAHAEGGGIWCVYQSHPVLENTLVALSPDGGGVWVYSNPGHQSDVTLTCSDVFGNVDGNYGGVIDDPTGSDGNFSADPLFCDAAAGDFSVSSASPCLPAYNPCGVQVGALGAGCSTPGDVDEGGIAGIVRNWQVPSPFVPGGAIRFTLAMPGQASLAVFDASGRAVRGLLANSALAAGSHEVRWDARDADGASVGAGVYFCRLEVNGRAETTKIVLAR